MAYTFTDGEILTAAKVNNHLVNPDGVPSLTMNSTDLDTIKTGGIYAGYTYTNGPPVPLNSLATMVVERYSADWVVQTFTVVSADRRETTWTRTFTGGTTWNPWRKLALKAEWQNYTPTIGGLTLGNGTVSARWIEVEKLVTAEVFIGLGSTSVVADTSVTLPKVAARNQRIGSGWLAPSGVSGSAFAAVAFATANPSLVLVRYLGLNGNFTALSPTGPSTWNSNGQIFVQFTYEAA